jgi:hypothetical protein
MMALTLVLRLHWAAKVWAANAKPCTAPAAAVTHEIPA